MDFTTKKCVPCEGGEDPLKRDKIDEYRKAINPQWEIIDVDCNSRSTRIIEDKALRRVFKFPSFKEAIEFVNKVADLAEDEGHHPDFRINYKKVTLELTTHAIGGLSENDFVMAAKIEQIL